MTIEQAIRNHWTTYQPLIDVVPASRVWVDENNGPDDLPFVVLTLESEMPRTFSSGDRSYSAVVRFHLYDDDFERGTALLETIRHRFDRADMPAGNRTILQARYTNKARQRAEDGVWRWLLDYTLLINEVTTNG